MRAQLNKMRYVAWDSVKTPMTAQGRIGRPGKRMFSESGIGASMAANAPG